MSRNSKQHDKQFKLDALKYVKEHHDLTQEECCKNLGISLSTLARWKAQFAENDGEMPFRGSGNYSSLPLILHSDRGSQYVSKAYREATQKFRLGYSHKGYPYNNANIESFHSLIKREWLNRFKIRDYDQAYRLVFEYIETFYNTVRIHSHCSYMSLVEFEKLYKKVAA